MMKKVLIVAAILGTGAFVGVLSGLRTILGWLDEAEAWQQP